MNKRAAAIIRNLLQESTFPAWAGETCRSCEEWHTALHHPNCPYLKAVNEAEQLLEELSG